MKIDLDNIDEQIFTVLTEEVENIVFTLEDENFTTKSKEPSTITLFPSIYLHRLPSVETGFDLENDRINGGIFTYELSVTSNNKDEVKEIMLAVAKVMKLMGFNATSLPFYAELENNLHKQSSRWQRVLYEGDLLDFKTS